MTARRRLLDFLSAYSEANPCRLRDADLAAAGVAPNKNYVSIALSQAVAAGVVARAGQFKGLGGERRLWLTGVDPARRAARPARADSRPRRTRQIGPVGVVAIDTPAPGRASGAQPEPGRSARGEPAAESLVLWLPADLAGAVRRLAVDRDQAVGPVVVDLIAAGLLLDAEDRREGLARTV